MPQEALIHCPACSDTMQKIPQGSFILDVCPSCGGSWYDKDELKQHIDAQKINPTPLPRPTITPPPQQFRSCPHCANRMRRTNFGIDSGILIDVCSDHGVFLDHGELDQIIAFTAARQRQAAGAAAPESNNYRGERINMPTYGANQASFDDARAEAAGERRMFESHEWHSRRMGGSLIVAVIESLAAVFKSDKKKK